MARSLTAIEKVEVLPGHRGDESKNSTRQDVVAGAFYGIDAVEVALAHIDQLIVAVISVFRSRNDIHNADWFFAALP